MRVAVFGYQSWGHRTLSAVINAGHEVVLVVTHPASDHPYEQMWADSVEELASEHELQVCVTERVGQDVIEALRDAAPDIIVANNWRTWLPPEVFSLAKHGALNVHDGLLPEYAGFSPILWALLNREIHVGVTVHEMDEVLDGGPIVAQRAIPVGPQDTTTDLVAKTIDLIEPLVERALSDVAQGTATAQPQDPTRATYFHKRGEQESRIDFTQPAEDIALLVRAQSDPYPNAYFEFRGQRVRVLSAHVSQGRFGGTPGRVTIPHEGGIAVVCGSPRANVPAPAIVLDRVRLDDNSELTATEFFGHRAGYIQPKV